MNYTYRRKPPEIEAIKFDGENFSECEKFIGKDNYDNTLKYPNIKTYVGTVGVEAGHFIIKSYDGKFTTLSEQVFRTIYEKTN